MTAKTVVSNNYSQLTKFVYVCTGLRLLPLSGEAMDMQEANALLHAMDIVDIYSSSWGPSDKGTVVEGPRTMGQIALKMEQAE